MPALRSDIETVSVPVTGIPKMKKLHGGFYMRRVWWIVQEIALDASARYSLIVSSALCHVSLIASAYMTSVTKLIST